MGPGDAFVEAPSVARSRTSVQKHERTEAIAVVGTRGATAAALDDARGSERSAPLSHACDSAVPYPPRTMKATRRARALDGIRIWALDASSAE